MLPARLPQTDHTPMEKSPLVCVKSLSKHQAAVNFMAVSECNRYLLSGGE